MATRQKTIRFAKPTTTALVADAAVTSLTSTTIYIPESSPTFRSVIVHVGFQDVVTATGGTITEFRVGLGLAAVAVSTITELDDIGHTGENIGGTLGPFDFTSYFTTNWTGTSMTWVGQVYFDQSTGTTLGMNNVTMWIDITYDYSDAAATQITTIAIPLESPTAALATTKTQIGTNQIPQLTGTGGLLEGISTVTVRDYFMMIEGNECNATATTDWVMSVEVDSLGALAFMLEEAGLASDRNDTWIHRMTGAEPSLTAAHAYNAWISTGAVTRNNHAVFTLYVTFEWAVSGTTNFLNSVLLPIDFRTAQGGATAAGDQVIGRVEVWVEEPTTIELKQSAARLGTSINQPLAGLAMSIGTQAARTYTHNVQVDAGGAQLQQRFDSGSAQGAGLTLDRGLNYIDVEVYATDATDNFNAINGYVLLNYRSGVAAGTPGSHNHTVKYYASGFDATATSRLKTGTVTPNLPETDYFVNGIGIQSVVWQSTTTPLGLAIDAEMLSGEGPADGWANFFTTFWAGTPELGFRMMYSSASSVFDRWSNDPDTKRLGVEVGRTYRFTGPTPLRLGSSLIISYHCITRSIAGTVSGYTGGGSGITVSAHRADTGEKIGSTTTASGGTYSITWFDDTISTYVEAQQDGTHVGRSQDGVAS